MPSPSCAAFAATVLVVCSSGAVAQAAPPQPGASAPSSSLAGYRRYAEQPVEPWRESNDRVGRIGGWRAYAREAAGNAPPAASVPAPGGAHEGHAGHGAR
ncbi:hypothetical protein [Piscinibacter sp.]|uniref:hypothetical protein n=1 Tax=Piscinibacter sp. TaxID=1903157 RepID=UPI002C7E6F75|nr:hypothetical protein [Albitalea sp.]HUG24124.1 hypothetical protein [Albitalea sp.]